MTRNIKSEQEASDWYDKGRVFHDQEKYEEAIECYDKAIQIEPEDIESWSDKGLSLFNLKKI